MTAAGGAGIYVGRNLKVIERPDIKTSMDLVQSCWIEVEPGINKKKIVIGCINRHRRANVEIFTDQLNELLRNLNHRKYQFYIPYLYLNLRGTHFRSALNSRDLISRTFLRLTRAALNSRLKIRASKMLFSICLVLYTI